MAALAWTNGQRLKLCPELLCSRSSNMYRRDSARALGSEAGDARRLPGLREHRGLHVFDGEVSFDVEGPEGPEPVNGDLPEHVDKALWKMFRLEVEEEGG